MKNFELKYGCNPNQKPASLYMHDGSELPITILNGRPGYINFMDALNSWQLVKELKEATGMACATSFKHVSPTSAAVGKPLPLDLKKACFVEDVEGLDENPLACAYVRARGTDRLCSFGDWVAAAELKFSGISSSAGMATSNSASISATRVTMSKESRILSSIRVVQVSKSTSGCSSERMFSRASIVKISFDK